MYPAFKRTSPGIVLVFVMKLFHFVLSAESLNTTPKTKHRRQMFQAITGYWNFEDKNDQKRKTLKNQNAP